MLALAGAFLLPYGVGADGAGGRVGERAVEVESSEELFDFVEEVLVRNVGRFCRESLRGGGFDLSKAAGDRAELILRELRWYTQA